MTRASSSARHARTLPNMANRTQGVGNCGATGWVTKPPSRLALARSARERDVAQLGPEVPARQVYSHTASVSWEPGTDGRRSMGARPIRTTTRRGGRRPLGGGWGCGRCGRSTGPGGWGSRCGRSPRCAARGGGLRRCSGRFQWRECRCGRGRRDSGEAEGLAFEGEAGEGADGVGGEGPGGGGLGMRVGWAR
jgi:hypothetical protein